MPVRLEKEGAVGVIVLDRPPANSYDYAFLRSFAGAIDDARADAEIRAVIVTSASEKFFSAGADVGAFAAGTSRSRFMTALLAHEAFRKMENTPLIFIAVIAGHCLGGGFELALACDIRIASTSAVMGLPETTLAIIPGGGGTQRLPRIAGQGRAKELIFTGRRISAADALQYGIVHEIAAPDEVRMRALAVARAIAANGPVAVRAAKEAIVRGLEMPLNEGVTLENELYGRTVPTKDRLEGLEAFREKRAPVYRGE